MNFPLGTRTTSTFDLTLEGQPVTLTATWQCTPTDRTDASWSTCTSPPNP